MKNEKLYKIRREEHENNYTTSQFEHFNGISCYPCYNMTSEDIKSLRFANKNAIKYHNALKLDGANDRAIILDTGDSVILRSYYTDVCEIEKSTLKFTKLWSGFSNTTLKHINLFRKRYNLDTISKYDWVMLKAYNE